MLECRNTKHRGLTSIKVGAPVHTKDGRTTMSSTAQVSLRFRRMFFIEIEIVPTKVSIYRFPDRKADSLVLVTSKSRLVFACEHENTEIEIKDAHFNSVCGF